MASWVHKEDVKVVQIYKELNVRDIYLIRFIVPSENSIFPEFYEVEIDNMKFPKELKYLIEGKVERCFFTYGMTEIDFYKVGGSFALTHSPRTGYNVQLILSDGELEKMVETIEKGEK